LKAGLKIGGLELRHNVFLAPMAGVTDLPFRLICKELGSELLYTEMINAKALCYEDEKTRSMTRIEKQEHPVALQIFGHEPEFIAEAASILNDNENEILDINMGCPAPKVVKNGDGSALMKNPELAGRIMEAAVKASKKPVTVKIRAGWDKDSINAVEMARIAQSCGISAIAVHARTTEQYYSGSADWSVIKAVKDSVSIPVIGNGDVQCAQGALNMLEKTGCDAVMIGRGAQGNPWIFNEVYRYLEYGEQVMEPPAAQKIETVLRHLELAVRIKGMHTGIVEMRKHIGWYLKGMKGSSKIKNEINTLYRLEEIKNILLCYKEELNVLLDT